MADRPNQTLRIAEDLASLPLPPEDVWVRQPRRRTWLPTLALAAVAAVVTLAVALPIAAQVAADRSGAGSAVSAAPTATGTPSKSLAATAPSCPDGQSPVLAISFPPAPGDAQGTGSATPEAAFRRAFPAMTTFTITHPFSSASGAPVWIVAGDRSFIAQAPGPADAVNNWFAYPATFAGCRSLTAPGVSIKVCGSVTGYAADSVRMLLTVTDRVSATTSNIQSISMQFSLPYAFAKDPPPADLGSWQAPPPQLVTVEGRLVDPDTGSLTARTLHDFTVTRVGACP